MDNNQDSSLRPNDATTEQAENQKAALDAAYESLRYTALALSFARACKLEAARRFGVSDDVAEEFAKDVIKYGVAIMAQIEDEAIKYETNKAGLQ